MIKLIWMDLLQLDDVAPQNSYFVAHMTDYTTGYQMAGVLENNILVP